MKWGRFGTFIAIVLIIFGLAAGSSFTLWKQVRLGLDLKGGFDLLYEISPAQGQTLTPAGIQAALQAVELRVNSTGVASPNIELENQKFIRVDLAGTFNQQQAEQIIGRTANLEIYGNVIKQKDGSVKPDPKTILVGGKDLESNAHWSTNQYGQNVVDLTFKNAGKWATITKAYTNKPIYTFLNDELLTSAVVQGEIPGGNTELSGSSAQPFTANYCIQLAKELNSGALPYPLTKVSSTNVGPSLGAASLKATMWAGLIAVILIFAFMIFMYRLAGLIADIAIIAYAYVLLLVFVGLHITLTLPGLAALVLGIGMAVDANIITYERIKDEVTNGKSLQSSVISGTRRALRTILDSNATTFIAGAVMYWFGQGDVRGFAIALMLSIVISLMTAVFLSRSMLLLFAKSGVVKRAWWYGYRKGAVQR